MTRSTPCSDAHVYLFGSRLDDAARGGDLDLYVELCHLVENRASAGARLAAKLQLTLGDQHIDVLITDPSTRRQRIHELVKAKGVEL